MLKRTIATLSLALTALNVAAQKATYAPTPPPMLVAPEKAKSSIGPVDIAQAAATFSIGDPTDEEQMYLELINRARANAIAEADRLIALAATNQDVFDQFVTAWNVDVALMKAQFATNPPVPPLSFNAKLTEAARKHSQFQFDTATQTHTGSGGSTLRERVEAEGYLWSNLGENVFLNATSPEHGHAGFEIDWGPGVGGMQTPPGHRNSIHSPNFTEIGIGIVNGTNSVNGNDAGPQVVTQDFGRAKNLLPYITGVAYYDINGNNFYDLGEGLPGVQVQVDGVSSFAITTKSGGFSVPVPANRSHTVRFGGAGHAEVVQTVNVTTNNVKLDFRPLYVVPIASGPTTAYVGIENIYNIAKLPGATGYFARLTELSPLANEGFEAAVMDPWIFTLMSDYPFLSTAVKASGSQSLHLGQMVVGGTVHPQIVLFRTPVLVGADARIDFKSRMAVASAAQFAALAVSADKGATWTKVWSQNGGDIAGEETSFSSKSASLAGFAGRPVHFRFIFDAGNGSVYTMDPADPNFNRIGWYLDDVTFVNLQSVGTVTEAAVGADARYTLPSLSLGTYSLEFQAIVGTRAFAYGTARQITVAANPPSVSLFKNMTVSATTVTVQFLSGASQGPFTLLTASSVDGPWTADTSATLTAQGGGIFLFTTERTPGARFFRVTVQ